jgi:hypothetical protein
MAELQSWVTLLQQLKFTFFIMQTVQNLHVREKNYINKLKIDMLKA